MEKEEPFSGQKTKSKMKKALKAINGKLSMDGKISSEDFKKLRNLKRQRHKFGAISCERDGKKFPSKLERAYYDKLKVMRESGEVLFFLMQTPFQLPGNVKYVVDFTVFWANGEVSFVDTKGRDTPVSSMKRKQVESLYPVTIEIVKKV
jgi:hypothetical protein